MKRIILVGVLSCLFASVASANLVGVLSTGSGSITGTGNWVLGGEGDVTMVYDVSPIVGGLHYEYLFNSPRGELSHILIQTSNNFGWDDISNMTGGNFEIGLWEAGSPGNETLARDLYGIKIDVEGSGPFEFGFDSRKVAVWGDFYARDGRAGGLGLNSAWNSGFFTDPIAYGCVRNHILVPDTVPVPLPSALLLGFAGIGAAGWKLRRLA